MATKPCFQKISKPFISNLLCESENEESIESNSTKTLSVKKEMSYKRVTLKGFNQRKYKVGSKKSQQQANSQALSRPRVKWKKMTDLETDCVEIHKYT